MIKKVLIFVGLILIAAAIVVAGTLNFERQKEPTTESVALAQAQTRVADVTNLKVKEIGNEYAILEWDTVTEATGYKILYGTKSVGDNEEYNRPAIDVTNINSFKVEKLSNNVTYYFSVIAVKGMEYSEYYSNEISVTPSSEGALAAPTIVSVNPLSSISFEIVFSKPMTIPTDAKSQITVTKAFDETVLAVQSVTATSAEKITVITAPQSIGSEYRITLTDQFKDSNGVAITELERADVFIGFAGAAGAVGAGSTSDLKITEIKNVSDSSIEVVFSKGIKLGSKPTDQIAILESSNPDVTLEVRDVVQNSSEANKILVVTDKQKAVSYTILVTSISDEAGASISQDNSTFEFKGFGSAATTTEPAATTPETTQNETSATTPATNEDALPDTGPGGILALFAGSMFIARRLLREPRK